MNEANTFLNSLPMPTQKLLLADWIERRKIGTLRGQGLASHALYIDMIAQENDMTIEEILSLNGYPV